MFENLSPKVPGHQRAENSSRRVTDEVKVADLLCDDAQPWAGAEGLYLWAEAYMVTQRESVRYCTVYLDQ